MGCTESASGNIAQWPKPKEYRTPENLAALVASLAIDKANVKVLDPCVGSGHLLAACRTRLQILSLTRSVVASLVGFEVDSSAAQRARKLLGPNADIVERDFLLDVPGSERYDVVVCNPPYDRHHDIPKWYKIRLREMIQAECGVVPSGLSSEYVYFIFKAAAVLRKGGRMAFIIPDELFQANYNNRLWAFLKGHFQIEAVIRFTPTLPIFPGIMTTTCVFLARKRRPIANQRTRFVSVWQWPGYLDLVAAAKKLRQDRSYSWGRVEIGRVQKFQGSAMTEEPRCLSGPDARLGLVFDVHRGLATGDNGFFLLSAPRAESLGIPRSVLVPVVRHATDLNGFVFDSLRLRELILSGAPNLLFSPRQVAGKKVLDYIRLGEALQINNSRLCESRRPWYAVKRGSPPVAFCTYMRRGLPIFSINRANAYAINTIHGLFPKRGSKVSGKTVARIIEYLNSSRASTAIESCTRTYSGGLKKLEPGDVERIRLPVALLPPRILDGPG